MLALRVGESDQWHITTRYACASGRNSTVLVLKLGKTQQNSEACKLILRARQTQQNSDESSKLRETQRTQTNSDELTTNSVKLTK